MVSGVSFKNPNADNSNVRRRGGISSGILFSFLFLIAVGIVYILVFLYSARQTSKNTSLKSDQQQNQVQIDAALQGAPAEFIAKSRALVSHRYTESTTSTILREFQKMIISGIVFESFNHVVDEDDQVASIEVSADASNLDTLAAQVEVWKNSPLFSRVRADGATKDEDTGFLKFNVEFVLAQNVADEQLEAEQ